MGLVGVGGSALQLQQAALWPMDWYGLALLAALAVAAFTSRWGRSRGPRQTAWVALRGVLALGACALVAFALVGLRACWFDSQRLEGALEGRDMQVVGVVRDMTQSNPLGLRFRLQVESARLDGVPVAFPARVDVGWYTGLSPQGAAADLSPWELQRQPQTLWPGERWQFTLRVKAPHGSINPHGFDYELWLWEQGVQATAYVRAGPQDAAPQRLEATPQYPVAQWRQALRQRIMQRVQDPQAAGLITALVVGDQSAIDRAGWDMFRATGVAHLVSISGLHITMFAWGATALVAWLWRRSQRLCLTVPAPTAALVAGLFLAVAYSVFSGWGLPAQRTCVMLATVTGLRVLGLRWPWPQVWTLALVLVVASDPWALLQPGFWLSFVAVGILFSSDIRRSVAQHGAVNDDLDGTKARLYWALACSLNALRGLVREQWTITLALAPLTVLLFGQVSVVGLLANLLAVPWVTLVLTPLAMLGTVAPALWLGAVAAAQALMAVLQTMAAWPGAVWVLAVPPLGLAMVAALGGAVLVLPLPWSLRLLGAPLVLAMLVWRPAAPAVGEFELLGADVGQGNAVLVRTASHALLYDAGPRYSLESDAGHRVLVPLLQALQTPLNRLVLSHSDTDHVGGAAALMAMQPGVDVWTSVPATHPLLAQSQVQRCQAGQSWVWDGVLFEVLHPRETDYGAVPPPKPNALSCVLRIVASARERSAQGLQATNNPASALLVGDIERAQEDALLARADANGLGDYPGLRSTILLVPHHGSKTSSSAQFLSAVRPSVALVQSGYRNRYGHPAAQVMARYEALAQGYGPQESLQIVDTPHCGAFIWQSWLPQNGACARESLRRYWHHRVP
jgi:competence protein ComEC